MNKASENTPQQMPVSLRKKSLSYIAELAVVFIIDICTNGRNLLYTLGFNLLNMKIFWLFSKVLYNAIQAKKYKSGTFKIYLK